MHSPLATHHEATLDRLDVVPEAVTRIVALARHAADGFLGSLTSEDKLLAALALVRADWLEGLGYTRDEALRRVGPHRAALVPQATRVLHAEGLV